MWECYAHIAYNTYLFNLFIIYIEYIIYIYIYICIYVHMYVCTELGNSSQKMLKFIQLKFYEQYPTNSLCTSYIYIYVRVNKIKNINSFTIWQIITLITNVQRIL